MNLTEFAAKNRRAALRMLPALTASGAVLASASIAFAAEEEGAEPALSPLAWQTDLALWTAVVFIVVVFVLGKFAFRPIVDALNKREKNEIDRLAAAEKANADAKELLEQYSRKLADAEDDVRRIIADAKADAERQAADVVGKAKEAAEAEHQRAVADIQSASDQALQELAAKSAGMAVDLAGKILREKIDPAKHEQLIERAVADIAK